MTPAIAALAQAIDDLQADDEERPGSAILDDIRALRQQIDRLEAVFTQCVTTAHVAGLANSEGFATTGAFLRHACHLTSGAARARVDVGVELTERPAIAEDFNTGTISYQHVKTIVDALRPLPPEMQRDAEPVLLQAARRYDAGRLAQIARRLRHIVDPDGQASIDERRYEDRWFEIPTSFQGVGMPRGVLDAESATIVRTAIDALSTPAGELDPRTPAQRRADALVEIARRALDSGDLPESGGERPHLCVDVDYATLKGESTAPAQLNFGEPIGIDAVRRVTCDAVVTRIVTAGDTATAADLPDGFAAAVGMKPPLRRSPKHQNDPIGAAPPGYLDALPAAYLDALPPPLRGPTQVLDVGRSSRTATLAIRKALAARDKGCVMPGCDRPPSRCEAHHVIHWADGGVTALHNMVLLCSFHHHFVHEYKWQIKIHADGTVTVTPPPAVAA